MISACRMILSEVGLLLVRGINPLERWRGARSGLRVASSGIWLWVILILVGALILVGLIWAIFALIGIRRKEERDMFNRHADQLGLSEEERTLLHNIAIHAGLRRLDTILVSEPLFERGLAAIGQAQSTGDLTARPQARMCASCTHLFALREKLGFQTPVREDQSTSVKLGEIPQGARLDISRQRSPENFQATCAGQTTNGELLVKPELEVKCPPGESWVVRYPKGGVLWEFDVWVVSSQEGKVVLKPRGSLRWINRRRFARIPTRRHAQVARFPFQHKEEALETPEFVPAVVVEIAGVGLLLKAPLDVAKDERVLVVVQLRPDKVIEGTGVVRRVDAQNGDGCLFAVELVGLTTSEVENLSKETHLAAAETQGIESQATRQAYAAAGQED